MKPILWKQLELYRYFGWDNQFSYEVQKQCTKFLSPFMAETSTEEFAWEKAPQAGQLEQTEFSSYQRMPVLNFFPFILKRE